MTLKLPKEQELQAVRDHWLGHSCLPFPAGGLVPRERTRPALGKEAALAARAQAIASADFAAALLAHEASAVQGLDNPKTPVTGLVAHAAIAWASRHTAWVNPAVSAPHSRGKAHATGHHPGALVLGAMAILSDNTQAADHWADASDRFLPNFGTRVKKDGGNRILNDALAAVPYASQAEPPCHDYRCECEAVTTPPKRGRAPVPRKDEDLQPIKALLAHPGAEWWLLGRLFLALLHGHLGWLPGHAQPTAAQDSLHRGAARLLRLRLHRPQDELDAGLAMGLAQGLVWMPPKEAVPLMAALPALLVDSVPDEPERVLNHALRYLCRQALGTEFFESLLPGVLRLARDLACDLSSPALVLQSGVSREACELIAKQMADKQRKLKEYLNPSAAALEHGKGKYPPCAIPNARFMKSKLFNRMRTIASYQRWMGQRGHDAVTLVLTPTAR